ncbi:MAG: BT1926 family outer membrane beta-barrel protein [Bacteroidales bacterium]
MAIAPTFLWAQAKSADQSKVSFAPKKGNWEFSVQLGKGHFFNDNGAYDLTHLLPKRPEINTGLGSGTQQATDPGVYLSLGSVNSNSFINMAGVQAAYFITDNINITLGGGLNIGNTPQKDYIEGLGDATKLDPVTYVPGMKYMQGKLTHQWYINIGSNYYFKTGNDRINPYLGVLAGYQMGRIQTNNPYTGLTISVPTGKTDENGKMTYEDVPSELVFPSSDKGMVQGWSGSIMAGVEFAMAPGFNIALEVRPASFTISQLSIMPTGQRSYAASYSQWSAFTCPMLRLSFRF